MILSIVCGAAAFAEPRNLDLAKQEIRAYVSSGDYRAEIARVADEARHWIRERCESELRSAKPRKLAIVLDLDETLLDNTGHMLNQDFGYVPAVWEAWVKEARAPAFAPVREVYALALELGVHVVFITGRSERQRPATEKNLRAIDCGDGAALMMRPDDSEDTVGAMKRVQREALAKKGFVVIANVGDQRSDFAGGGAEREFKLPNPFYLTE